MIYCPKFNPDRDIQDVPEDSLSYSPTDALLSGAVDTTVNLSYNGCDNPYMINRRVVNEIDAIAVADQLARQVDKKDVKKDVKE